MPGPILAYYRVSTQKQGRSGLGLEAQRKAVAAYAAQHGLQLVSLPKSRLAKAATPLNAARCSPKLCRRQGN
jgi:hypothetical protein